MGSSLLACLRLLAYLSWTALLVPIQAAAMALRLPVRTCIPRYYHRVCARLLGLRVEVRGTMAPARPTLFVCNHMSYLDITVLGAVIEGSFVAKAEVGRWPLFGLLARLQRSIFVDRRAANAQAHRNSLQQRLQAGDSLILFPEGTSGDGNRTLPFKTSLFQVAALEVGGRPITVQPVSVAATALDGIPLGRMLRPLYAWYGDMDLVSHIWSMIGAGELTVVVEFHPPVTIAEMGSRKALAEHCWRTVAIGVAAANAGRSARSAAA